MVASADAAGEACVLLGGGSNVLIADGGLAALVVAVQTRGVHIMPQGERALVTAAAGEVWDALVERCTQEGLAGIECLSGIPGLVGATPIQNVGAYGQEVSDTIVSVRAFDRHERRVVELPAEACAFGYRDSAFKSRWPGRFVVLSVTFALRCGLPSPPRYAELSKALDGEPAPTSARLREVIIALRRKKSMVLDPADPDSRSAGSFFTNALLDAPSLAALRARLGDAGEPPVFEAGPAHWKVAAAWLIERAGFSRGHRMGRAGLSSKHALAIVNRDGASAAELIALAQQIQRGVLDRFGVWLEPEPVLLGFAGRPLDRPA